MSETPTQFPSITREFILARAKSVIGRGTYKLGRGGFDPNARFPWSTVTELLDCSGFIAWCIAEDRENSGIPGGWIETTAVFNDAIGTRRMFVLAPNVAQPGDIIVYPDTKVREGASFYSRQGHIGVVSRVDSDGKPQSAIHCSKGHFNRFDHAIAETNVNGFIAAKAIVVVPVKLEAA